MSTIARRGSATAFWTLNTQTKNIVIPSGTQVGDLLVLGISSGLAGIDSVPSGWTRPTGGQATATNVFGDFIQRIAQAGDAGSTLTITAATPNKGAMSMAAYYNMNSSTPLTGFIVTPETAAVSSHAAGTVTVSQIGWLVRMLALRDTATATTAWSAPTGTTLLLNTAAGGSNNVRHLLADSNGDVAVNAYGGSWVTDATSANAIDYGFAIVPISSAAIIRPLSDITNSGWTIVGGASAAAVTADDDPSTYAESTAGAVNQVLEVLMNVFGVAPDSFTYKLYGTGSPTAMSVKTELVQGSTVLAVLGTYTTVVTTETPVTYTLTTGQKAAMTALTDIRLRFTVSVS